MMAPFHILHRNQRPCPQYQSDGDVPSSQPKVQKTWDPRIGPTITRGEVHET
jgi:hypothetical protein